MTANANELTQATQSTPFHVFLDSPANSWEPGLNLSSANAAAPQTPDAAVAE